MRLFKLFFVLLFAALTSVQGQDLVTRYMNSKHYKGEERFPDWTRKVEKLSKHRALAFEVEGGVELEDGTFEFKYNGTRNFNVIAYLGVKNIPNYPNRTCTEPISVYGWKWFSDVYGKSLKKRRYNGYIMWSTDTKYKFKSLTVQSPRYSAFGERTGPSRNSTKVKTRNSLVTIAGESFQDQTFDIAPGAGKNDGKSYFNDTELRTKGIFRLDKALIGKTITIYIDWRDSTGFIVKYKILVKIVE